MVHLLGDVVHPRQPYTGATYKLHDNTCIVPVAKAVLVAAPGGAERAVPSGCVLVRAVQRLTYGRATVRVPADGFGLREYTVGMHFTEIQQEGWTGSEDAEDGFVVFDKMDDIRSSSQQDAVHASPNKVFVVPEWWVQPASYFRSTARLGHYNDSRCEKCSKRGMLYLCDGCPRAYHAACVSEEHLRAAKSDPPWHCPVCSPRST